MAAGKSEASANLGRPGSPGTLPRRPGRRARPRWAWCRSTHSAGAGRTGSTAISSVPPEWQVMTSSMTPSPRRPSAGASFESRSSRGCRRRASGALPGPWTVARTSRAPARSSHPDGRCGARLAAPTSAAGPRRRPSRRRRGARPRPARGPGGERRGPRRVVQARRDGRDGYAVTPFSWRLIAQTFWVLNSDVVADPEVPQCIDDGVGRLRRRADRWAERAAGDRQRRRRTAPWHLGVRNIDIPITPQKVWAILHEKGVTA